MALTSAEWAERILAAAPSGAPELSASVFIKRTDGATGAVLAICSDGENYYLKGRKLARLNVNEQIASHVGKAIGAPVVDVAIVQVAKEFCMSAETCHICPGLAHASRELPRSAFDRAYRHMPANRARFASLAILYGLLGGNDAQYLYETTRPYRVWSFDHGELFPASGDADFDTLKRTTFSSDAGGPTAYEAIVSQVGLGRRELALAGAGLAQLTDDEIAVAVAAPPAEWGISKTGRVLRAMFLERRRESLKKRVQA